MANTIEMQEDWAAVVQERLSDVALWNVINNVEIKDSQVFHAPYETYASFQSHTRGSAYTHQDVTLTDESVTVSNSVILPQFIDRIDLQQSNYASLMSLAESQGVTANEKLDNLMLAEHANWTDIGDDGSGNFEDGETTQITIDNSTIDDVIHAVFREIRAAKGDNLANRNGVFFVWRPEDFEQLTKYAANQGFMTADQVITEGGVYGMRYLGAVHYVSNQHTANHVFAGVRNTHFLGAPTGGFPLVYSVDEPTAKEAGSNEAGNLSALSMVSRIDYAYKTWTNLKPVLFDINVA